MKLSENGKAFICSHEGCILSAYQDGGGIWTIGYGHTINVSSTDIISQAQAEVFLLQDLTPVEACINKKVAVSLNQNQFDSLCSFIFNVGVSAFNNSTLLKKLNANDFTGAANEFTRWVYDNGKFIEGLFNRRQHEKNLFLAR